MAPAAVQRAGNRIVAKAQSAESVSSLVNEVSGMLALCRDVAMALIETGEQWTTRGSFSSFFRRTDHDQARMRVQERLSSTIVAVEEIRRRDINSDAIRAAYHLSSMRKCCDRCAELNKKNVQAGRAFACFAQQLAQHGTAAASRFHLNEEGQIVERR